MGVGSARGRSGRGAAHPAGGFSGFCPGRDTPGPKFKVMRHSYAGAITCQCGRPALAAPCHAHTRVRCSSSTFSSTQKSAPAFLCSDTSGAAAAAGCWLFASSTRLDMTPSG